MLATREDLAANYRLCDPSGAVLGISRVHFEAIGLNIGGHSNQMPDEYQPLVADGPVAYHSKLPLARWAALLRSMEFAAVSYHAGTYLCNAMLYLSHDHAAQQELKTLATFIHLPLCPEQVVGGKQDLASMPSSSVAQGLLHVLRDLEEGTNFV